MTDDRWFTPIERRQDAQLRLFCFPFAGGSAQVFAGWRIEIEGRLEILAAQLPGRGARLREPPIVQPAPLVSALTNAVAAHADRPYALFGHSLGAFLAFGVARRLRLLGKPTPAHLIVAGQRAPHLASREKNLSSLDDEAFIAALAEYGGTPREILSDADFMKLLLPALRADFMVAESFAYRDAPPLDCPITAFGGDHDDTANAEELGAWRAHTNARFEARILPGGHFFLDSARDSLLTGIAETLAATPPAHTR